MPANSMLIRRLRENNKYFREISKSQESVSTRSSSKTRSKSVVFVSLGLGNPDTIIIRPILRLQSHRQTDTQIHMVIGKHCSNGILRHEPIIAFSVSVSYLQVLLL